MAEEAKWYVAHTYSGYENKVKANIEKSVENRGMQDLILDVKVPTEEVIEENGDKKKVGTLSEIHVVLQDSLDRVQSLFRFRTKKLNAWVLKLFV